MKHIPIPKTRYLPNSVALILAAWMALLALTSPVSAADRDKVAAFLQVTGFDVALDSIAQSAGSAPQMLGIDANAFGTSWTRLAAEVFDTKLDELKNSVALSKEGLKASKRVLKEIEQHRRRTKREWKSQMRGFLKEFGLSVDDHQPIFYSIKTWNALVGT